MKKLLPSEKLKVKQGKFFLGFTGKSFKELQSSMFNPNRVTVAPKV